MLSQVVSFFSGKKSHLVGIAMIAYGALGFILKQTTADQAVHYVTEGLGIMALRAGVEKAIQAPVAAKKHR